ncbi:E2-like enzyme [Ranunculus cassubicifolius]
MVLSQKLHEAFKGTVERITNYRTVSAFKEKGVLSVDEFIKAGDNLKNKCPTWQWESGEPSKRKSYLPKDKQYLVTRNVLRPSCPIVLLDGSIHFWNPDNRCLCVYNLKEESICFMELPVGSFDSCAMGMGHLGVSAESLYYSEGSKNHFRVWVLDGAKWFLKHSIDFESLVDELEETFESDYLFYPLAFHPLNDIIVLARLIHGPKVVLYHMDTTIIEVVKNIDSSLYFPVIPYALSAWHPFVKHH